MRMLLKVLSISTFLYFGSYVAADDMQLDLSTELRLAESRMPVATKINLVFHTNGQLLSEVK